MWYAESAHATLGMRVYMPGSCGFLMSGLASHADAQDESPEGRGKSDADALTVVIVPVVW